jgi:hypothetical protein
MWTTRPYEDHYPPSRETLRNLDWDILEMIGNEKSEVTHCRRKLFEVVRQGTLERYD